jgi:hypothetical protein
MFRLCLAGIVWPQTPRAHPLFLHKPPIGQAAAVNETHVVMVDPLPATVLAGDVLTSISWMPSFTAYNNTYRNNRAR